MTRVSKRYAEALCNIAVEKNQLVAYETDLVTCTTIIEDGGFIHEFLKNPENGKENKHNLLDGLFAATIHTDVLNFLKLLVDKDRIVFLKEITTLYSELVATYQNILAVDLYSAFQMDNDQLSNIKMMLIKKYNVSDVTFSQHIDSALVGGFRVVIGNDVIDNSVSGMMETMKKSIVSR